VLATVLNNRFPGRLTTDAGAKALTLNVPRAGVVGEPGMDYNAGSDEFGVITFKEASKRYEIGDRLELIVPHCDPVVNLYDVIYGTRTIAWKWCGRSPRAGNRNSRPPFRRLHRSCLFILTLSNSFVRAIAAT
jgi:hypothetical protein